MISKKVREPTRNSVCCQMKSGKFPMQTENEQCKINSKMMKMMTMKRMKLPKTIRKALMKMVRYWKCPEQCYIENDSFKQF